MTSTARHRERQLLGPNTENVYKAWAAGSTDDLGAYVVSDESDSMDDVVTDNFRKRINEGAVINNPCYYTKLGRAVSGSTLFRHYTNTAKTTLDYTITGPYCARAYDNGWTPLPALSLDIDVLIEKCKLQALAGMDKTPYAFGEDILEVKETLDFIRSPLGALSDLGTKFNRTYQKMLRTTRRTNYDLLQAHARVWVQYRFALSPLVRSVQDALEAFQVEHSFVPPARLTSRGFDVTEDTQARSAEGSFSFTYDENLSMKVEGKATILYTVENPVRDWNFRLGLRAKDLPTVVWQIMPYSFMVDRLLDVSSFSKGVMNLADPRVKILSACYRRKVWKEYNITLTGRNDSKSTIYSGDTLNNTEFRYERVPWNPTLSDTLPSFTPGNVIDSATKITDLVSLVLNKFNPFYKAGII